PLLCCENTYGSPENNDIDFFPDELGDDLARTLAAALRPSNLDRDGPTLDPAEFAQPLHESGDPLILNRSRHWAQGPMVGSLGVCCPLAASGHAPAPPTSVMNWRRLRPNMEFTPPRWVRRTLSLPPSGWAGLWGRPELF